MGRQEACFSQPLLHHGLSHIRDTPSNAYTIPIDNCSLSLSPASCPIALTQLPFRCLQGATEWVHQFMTGPTAAVVVMASL